MVNNNHFKALFLINFVITLGFGITDAFFSMYIFSLGARGLLLGLPLIFYSLSKILFSPIMGASSDRIGHRTIIAASLILYLFVSVSYFFTSNLAVITVLRLLQGVGCAMFRPVIVSMASEGISNEKRASVMGTFDMSFYGALCVGPVVGGVLKEMWGFKGIFATLSLFCIVAILVTIICIPAKKIEQNKQTAGIKSEYFKNLIQITSHRNVRGLLAFIFGRACGISLLGVFMPIMLLTKLGLSNIQTGLVMASSTMVITLMLRPAGMLSDRAPRRSLVVVGGTAVSLLYFLIPVANGFHQILILGVGIGLFSVLSQPASTALLIEEGSRHGMGLTAGTFNAVLNMGFVAGPIFGAGMQYTFGLTSVFYAAGAMGLVAVGLFMTNIVSEDTPPPSFFIFDEVSGHKFLSRS